MIRCSPAARARAACPHRRLSRLLAAELGAAFALGPSTLRPWASASFVGARHLYACEAPSGARACVQDRLAAVEWRLPGHIVADIAVEAHGDTLVIEILTVED